MPNQWSNVRQCRVLSDHVSTNVRMPPHDLPLFLSERSRLVENIVAHSNLAEVME